MKFCIFGLSLLILASCFRIESPQNTRPNILAVYPSSDSLPENLLRFYIQFSQPMKAVENLENIKLLDENGWEVKGAIFNNVYELWDSEQKQLTLILDPARVKEGLLANQRLGRALVPGQHFQLLIEKAEDIDGNRLEKPFAKRFFVTQADTSPPDINLWTVVAPTSNSKVPLKIIFPQALDQLSLSNRIILINAENEMIRGVVELANQEKEWRFFPSQKWDKGHYTVKVNSRLEDPAGNNLNGLFDHAIGSLKYQEEGVLLELKVEIR